MSDEPDPNRPWPKGEEPRLEMLMDWLDEFADHDRVIAGEYTVGELIDDLLSQINNDWSDGIDAMGEDA